MTIVSDRYGFIFLKTRKTAGSSIEHWLLPRIDIDDYVATSTENKPVPVRFWNTPDPTVGVPPFLNVIKPTVRTLGGKRRFGLRLTQHMIAADLIKLIGYEKYKSYLTFCVERHPYERFVSLWQWRCHRLKTEIGFDDFIDLCQTDPDHKLVHRFRNSAFYMIDGQIVVDKIIKFPDFRDEITVLARERGLHVGSGTFPLIKSHVRTGRAPLDRRQKTIIHQLVPEEIETYESL